MVQTSPVVYMMPWVVVMIYTTTSQIPAYFWAHMRASFLAWWWAASRIKKKFYSCGGKKMKKGSCNNESAELNFILTHRMWEWSSLQTVLPQWLNEMPTSVAEKNWINKKSCKIPSRLDAVRQRTSNVRHHSSLADNAGVQRNTLK